MIEGVTIALLILLCIGWATKADMEGAETMDLMGLVFGSIAIGCLITKTFWC